MNDILSLLRGELSASARVWTALAPGLVIVAYMVVGAIVFVLRNALRGRYDDPEISRRGATFLLPRSVRQYFSFVIQPIWRVIRGLGLPANALTTLSVLLAGAAAVSVAAGRFALGGWLYLFGGLCDHLDGRIARDQGTASDAGEALDAVLDRVADGLMLIGLSWYYRETWVLPVTGAAMLGVFLVPYVRAKAEALGVDLGEDVGLMQRPERVVLLGLSVALSPVLAALHAPADPHPMHRLAAVVLVLVAISSLVTAVRRELFLLKALDPSATSPPWTSLDRGGLIRFSISSGIATALEFALLMALVEVAGLRPWLAAIFGGLLGGLVNFTINRVWAFGVRGRALGQVARYAFASGTSALLYGGGIAVLMGLPRMDYRVAWAITAGCVFLLWNYPLNRDYVFREPGGRRTAAERDERRTEGGDDTPPAAPARAEPAPEGRAP